MNYKKRVRGAFLIAAGLTVLVFGNWGCSSGTKPANVASAVQPVNAPTPTVQQIIDAKRKEAEQAKAADPMNQVYAAANKAASSAPKLGNPQMSKTQTEDLIKRSTADSAKRALACPSPPCG